MAWYDEAVFYHIYPLGLTGAPKTNSYGEAEHRLNTLIPWISHIREIGCNALYIGPLFESVGHGYETTDYKKLDSRLGTNEDLTAFVAECHRQGVRVILDGVFNHTGRDFFAFQDIKKNRENSPYKDWYCRVNFYGNNEYNDGFSYENWGGYDLLAKLNQNNPAVRDYICDVIRFWASEFHIDGIRLDAADVLDFGYMQALRHTANEISPDFWLMGEVIHGDYTRWVNEGTLHSVTNYHLHKALYSGHNDHNYFEIAHTVKRLYEMGGNRPDGLKLYNFVDNHDVERIHTKLNNKDHFGPVHVLMYTLPGVPSVYYGSEFGIEGKKERYSDDSLRPALNLADYEDAAEHNRCTRLISALGRIRQKVKALSYGDYKELTLTNRQYAFSRTYEGVSAVIAVNNDDHEAVLNLPAGGDTEYVELLSGETTAVSGGRINVKVEANSGGIWVPADLVEEEDRKSMAAGGEGDKVPDAGRKAESRGSLAAGKRAKSGKDTAAGKDEKAGGAQKAMKPGKVSEIEKAVESGTTQEGQKASDSGEIQGSRKMAESKAAQGTGKVAEFGKGQEGQEGQKTSTSGKEQKTRKTAEPGTDRGGQKTAGSEATPKAQKPSEPGAAGKARASSDHLQPETVSKSAEASKKVPKTYEEMTIEELQEAILDKMRKNGPITDQMLKDVRENVYHNSLLNWVRSFR